MKIIFLQCGTIKTKRHLIEGGLMVDELFKVPVPFFLIEYDKNLILFDVGYGYGSINSTDIGDYIPIMTEEDYIVNQLASIGINSNDITHIILSHLHEDHAAGLDAFKDIPCFLQKDELSVHNADKFIKKHPVSWQFIDGDYDLFGDGRILIISTPGHSAGHQSLLLTEDDGRKTLLTADAAYRPSTLGRTFPEKSTMQSLARIKKLKKQGVNIIYGHDPEQWSMLFSRKSINHDYAGQKKYT